MKPYPKIKHLLVDDMAKFLSISKQVLKRNESTMFPKMKHNANGWRYTNVYDLCEAYANYWNEKPSWDYVASWLYEWGVTLPAAANNILLRLKSHNKII